MSRPLLKQQGNEGIPAGQEFQYGAAMVNLQDQHGSGAPVLEGNNADDDDEDDGGGGDGVVDYYDDPHQSGPSSENFLSKNVDYDNRDGDGNPIPLEVHRTWVQWMKHWKPCSLVAMLGLLNSLNTTLISPLIPFLISAYYGGGDIGNKKAVQTTTIFDSTGALIAMLFVPIYGKLLDTLGRRPFFILQAILGTLPPAFLFALPRNPLWYLASNQMSLLFSKTYTVCFIIDCYEEKDRSKSMAIVLGVIGLGSFIAPVAPSLSHQTIYILAVAFAMARIPIAFFLIKETLPSAQRRIFQWSFLNPNPTPCLRLLWNNRVLRAITGLIAAAMTAVVGTKDIMVYFLIETTDFIVPDAYRMGMIMGLLIPFYMLVVFPILSKKVRPTRVMFISFIMMVLGLFFLMVSSQPWMVYVLVSPTLLGGLLEEPAAIGIFTNAGDRGNQGMRIAGIYAVIDFIGAATPLVIGQIYKALPKDLSWMSFLLCLCFVMPAVPVIWFWLPKWIADDRDEQIQRALFAARTPDDNSSTSGV